ncbi:TlpA disulfide reductase family protein [Psychroserpens sp. SPM9]|uniref:TlpA family protein disulfide reductase n=1 Tax=Psychroserpens sp. SPM9 TaxID=2975598 RepID=UPI0021A292C4|nr:TlpA disulfide reductase family protein [Psychroserpens sp. SPM9]MDG5492601.1 TlpA disulfide reductase family protein [Psychroserpens sp. SPM9]
MKHVLIILSIGVFFLNCDVQPDPVSFSDEALNATFINSEGESVNFKSILETHKGKTILIDVWASWCRDCLVGFPGLKALQNDYDEVAYVFLSMDKTQESWKNGIKKYNIKGDHYFMLSGWDSAFSKAIDLDWVPRYMVIDTKGAIKLYRAIKIDDPKIREHLK